MQALEPTRCVTNTLESSAAVGCSRRHRRASITPAAHSPCHSHIDPPTFLRVSRCHGSTAKAWKAPDSYIHLRAVRSGAAQRCYDDTCHTCYMLPQHKACMSKAGARSILAAEDAATGHAAVGRVETPRWPGGHGGIDAHPEPYHSSHKLCRMLGLWTNSTPQEGATVRNRRPSLNTTATPALTSAPRDTRKLVMASTLGSGCPGRSTAACCSTCCCCTTPL
jgi:hypothetical protein